MKTDTERFCDELAKQNLQPFEMLGKLKDFCQSIEDERNALRESKLWENRGRGGMVSPHP